MKRARIWLPVLVAGVFLAATVAAQTVVVAPCKDKTGTKLGRDTRLALTKALETEGLLVIPYRQYMQEVMRQKIGRQNALTRWGKKRIAKALSLDGVVGSAAVKKGGALLIAVYLYDQESEELLKKAYRVRKPRFPRKTAGKLAAEMAAKLRAVGPKPPVVAAAPPEDPEEMALVPLVPPSAPAPPAPPSPEKPAPTPEKPAPATEKEAPASGLDLSDKPAAEDKPADDDSAAPAPADKKQWDKFVKMAEEGTTLAPSGDDELSTDAAAEKPSDEAVAPRPEATATARFRPEPDETAAATIPEVMLAAGLSISTRGGLSPRHEAGAYPGVRIEGRGFLGAFLDTIVARDIGLEAGFQHSMGLKAEPELVDDSWDAAQMQWGIGLVYRLSLDSLTLAPAFLFRFGYGGVSYAIDLDHPDVLDASYTYTHGTVEVHLTLVEELLGCYLAGGYVFDVWPSDSVSGNGSGFTLALGVRVELFDLLTLGAGYEQLQFVFDDHALGETSDRFQSYFLRAGWSMR